MSDDRYVLIVGSPRSGTSLLRRVLSHSAGLCGHPLEPQYILDLYQRFGFTISDVAGALDLLVSHRMFPAELINAAVLRNRLGGRPSIDLAEFLAVCYRVMRGDSAQTVLLKHPTLVVHPEVMRRLFPNLRIIQCVRDPRANILSRRTRWPATNLWTAATLWSESIQAGRRFHAETGTPYVEIRYEDLLTSPESTCRTLCEFLHVPFEPAMLVVDYAMDEFTPSQPGVSDTHHFQSFEAQRIDNWRRFLEPAEVRLIESRCREGMELFGYAPTTPRVNPVEYYGYYCTERGRAEGKALRRRLRHYLIRSAWRSFASSV
jgi:hypothetical protein